MKIYLKFDNTFVKWAIMKKFELCKFEKLLQHSAFCNFLVANFDFGTIHKILDFGGTFPPLVSFWAFFVPPSGETFFMDGPLVTFTLITK